jgi:hypothetical protein
MLGIEIISSLKYSILIKNGQLYCKVVKYNICVFFFRGISNLTAAAEDISEQCDGAQSLEYTVLLYLATGNWSDCEYDYTNCTKGLYLGTQIREVGCIDQITNETNVDCNDDLLPASSRVTFLCYFFYS